MSSRQRAEPPDRPRRASPASASGRVSRRGSAAAKDGARAVDSADAQAARHARTRVAHASEIFEDYVETIADLIDHRGEARVVDIAKCIGVTHVTVIRTIARMQKAGLVVTEPYRAIFLTDAGRKLAESSRRRHQIVLDFLRWLGVGEAAAQADAEGIEHHVSKETLAAFERAVKGRKG